MMTLYDPKQMLVKRRKKNMMYWHFYDDHATTQLHILSLDPRVSALLQLLVKLLYK